MTISKKKMALIGGGIGAVVLLAGAGAVIAKGNYYHGMGHHGPMGGAHMEAMIAQIDGNGDGNLSAAEINDFRTTRFSAMDTDQDGELTPKELTDGVRAMAFATLDTDGDGFISQTEFQAGAMGVSHRVERKFHRIDDDDNGRISEEELTAMTDRVLSWVDENDDGTLDAGELSEIRSRHHR